MGMTTVPAQSTGEQTVSSDKLSTFEQQLTIWLLLSVEMKAPSEHKQSLVVSFADGHASETNFEFLIPTAAMLESQA